MLDAYQLTLIHTFRLACPEPLSSFNFVFDIEVLQGQILESDQDQITEALVVIGVRDSLKIVYHYNKKYSIPSCNHLFKRIHCHDFLIPKEPSFLDFRIASIAVSQGPWLHLTASAGGKSDDHRLLSIYFEVNSHQMHLTNESNKFQTCQLFNPIIDYFHKASQLLMQPQLTSIETFISVDQTASDNFVIKVKLKFTPDELTSLLVAPCILEDPQKSSNNASFDESVLNVMTQFWSLELRLYDDDCTSSRSMYYHWDQQKIKLLENSIFVANLEPDFEIPHVPLDKHLSLSWNLRKLNPENLYHLFDKLPYDLVEMVKRVMLTVTNSTQYFVNCFHNHKITIVDFIQPFTANCNFFADLLVPDKTMLYLDYDWFTEYFLSSISMKFALKLDQSKSDLKVTVYSSEMDSKIPIVFSWSSKKRSASITSPLASLAWQIHSVSTANVRKCDIKTVNSTMEQLRKLIQTQATLKSLAADESLYQCDNNRRLIENRLLEALSTLRLFKLDE
ncbi:hypothetical protein Ciccas_001579 [Cichlidogyrus casuarinus]|uniref:Uncharacterized protein n=1 Tax=Cichlidogyrus casuarinus TaxID=1844966 RepID=A0ABD2QJR8_9PLAT